MSKVDPYSDSQKIGEAYAKLISTPSEKFDVCESYGGGFELSLNGEECAGGSYDLLLQRGGNAIFLASAGNALNRVVAYYKKVWVNDEQKLAVQLPPTQGALELC